MSINFSVFKNNVSGWIEREYDRFEKDFQKKTETEFEGIIKKEQLTINNYIRNLIDEIQFEVRKDLKEKFDYQEVRGLYEEYQIKIKPYKFSLMEYKITPNKKESTFERIESNSEISSKEHSQSVNRKRQQSMIIGASLGGLLGAGIGFKTVNPMMFKIISTPAGLFLGAIVGGYIAMQLLPISQVYKQPNRVNPVQNSSVSRLYQETASTVENSEKVKSIDIVLRERKLLVEQKLNEIINQMEHHYNQLLTSVNK